MSLTQWIAHNQLVTGFTLGGLWTILLLKLVEQTKANQKMKSEKLEQFYSKDEVAEK